MLQEAVSEEVLVEMARECRLIGRAARIFVSPGEVGKHFKSDPRLQCDQVRMKGGHGWMEEATWLR